MDWISKPRGMFYSATPLKLPQLVREDVDSAVAVRPMRGWQFPCTDRDEMQPKCPADIGLACSWGHKPDQKVKPGNHTAGKDGIEARPSKTPNKSG